MLLTQPWKVGPTHLPFKKKKKKKKNKGKVKLNTSKFQRTNSPHLIYLKNFTRESLKKTKGTVEHPNLTKSWTSLNLKKLT